MPQGVVVAGDVASWVGNVLSLDMPLAGVTLQQLMAANGAGLELIRDLMAITLDTLRARIAVLVEVATSQAGRRLADGVTATVVVNTSPFSPAEEQQRVADRTDIQKQRPKLYSAVADSNVSSIVTGQDTLTPDSMLGAVSAVMTDSTVLMAAGGELAIVTGSPSLSLSANMQGVQVKNSNSDEVRQSLVRSDATDDESGVKWVWALVGTCDCAACGWYELFIMYMTNF